MEIDWMLVCRYGFVVLAIVYLVTTGTLTVDVALAALVGLVFPMNATKTMATGVFVKPKKK